MNVDGDVVAIVPARGGSKGIPDKNIRRLAGRPLLTYSIDAATMASQVDRVIVTTDDPEISEIAKRAGADVPFERPEELATDEAPVGPAIEHAIQYCAEVEAVRYRRLVLLQPTSPLRTAADIDSAINQLAHSEADSIVSVYPSHDHRWRLESGDARKVHPTGRVRRQDMQPEFVENGAIYATQIEGFMETGELLNGRTVLYEMPEWRSVDIDSPFDLWLAEQILDDWNGS